MVNGNLLFFDLTCRCGRAPQLGIAPQDLLFFLVILGHRGLHERPERDRVNLLPFVDVDRPPRVAFQAGIEEARWVRDPCSPGERELHDLLVRFPGADNPVVRPDRNHPLPLLGHLGVGFQDQRPHAGQSLPAPSPRSRIRWSMSRDASLAPGPAFGPVFGAGLAADLVGLLAREAPLAFGFISIHLVARCATWWHTATRTSTDR